MHAWYQSQEECHACAIGLNGAILIIGRNIIHAGDGGHILGVFDTMTPFSLLHSQPKEYLIADTGRQNEVKKEQHLVKNRAVGD